MSNAEVPVAAQAHALHAHHFPSLGVQTHALRLGMWLFLGSEVLLFAGLFTGYAEYRGSYPEAFQAASRHLNLWMGAFNTVLLISSSFTVALAHWSASVGKSRRAGVLLFVSVAMGLGFLVVKGFEYAHKFHEGALPGKYYALESLQLPGAAMFFTVYFLATGLHALHVCVGMGALAFVGVRAWNLRYTAEQYTGVELSGLYWHLVDLVWIFLFPLLYLV